jgi:hypothetical protein
VTMISMRSAMLDHRPVHVVGDDGGREGGGVALDLAPCVAAGRPGVLDGGHDGMVGAGEHEDPAATGPGRPLDPDRVRAGPVGDPYPGARRGAAELEAGVGLAVDGGGRGEALAGDGSAGLLGVRGELPGEVVQRRGGGSAERVGGGTDSHT